MTTEESIARIREKYSLTNQSGGMSTELARLCDALDVAERALERITDACANKWARDTARKARAEIARILSGGEE